MEDTISQYIELVLQREPEEGEAEGWALLIANGQLTLDEVRQSIIDSAEAVSDVYPVILAYQAIYGRVPDAAGLNYWVNVYRGVQDLDDPTTPTQNEAMIAVLRAFVNPELTPEFVDRFGANPTAAQFVASSYTNVLNRAPDQDGLNYWTNRYNEVRAELEAANPGWSQDQINVEVRTIILEQFVSSQEYSDATQAAIDGYLNAVAQGEDGAYEGTLWSFDPEGTVGDTIRLTTGTDAGPDFTGGDGDDVFQADVEGTALLPLQTLNNTDNLDGGGGWNTLNAQLVDPYTVPAGLSNIQEINLSSPPGLVPLILPFPTILDLVNVDDGSLKVLGFSAMGNPLMGGAQVAVRNIQSEIETLNFRNTWAEIYIEHIGETLAGDEDALDINLFNSEVALDLDHWNGAPEDEGYEAINIHSTGPIGNGLELQGDAATPNTVMVTGDADLWIDTPVDDEGLSFNHLRTFDASGLTADLWAQFRGDAVELDEDEEPVLADVSITGAQGDNTFDVDGSTSGNLTFETFDGDDTIWIDDHEGDLSFSLGEGDNLVDIDSVEGDVTVTAGDGDNIVRVNEVVDGEISVTTGDGDDLVQLDLNLFNEDDEGAAVTLDLGGGANTLRVVPGTFVPGGNVSFAAANITGVQTLSVQPPFAVGAGGGSVDLDGLDDLEIIVFEDAVTLNGVAELENAPDALALTFESTLTLNGAGRLVIEDTESLTVNAIGDANIGGGLIFEDVEEITVNVGTALAPATFTFGAAGFIEADDLEALTVNLNGGSTFNGPVTAASTVVSLESLVVTGDLGSTLTMVFSEVATPNLTTIDLGGHAGQANITIDLDDGDVAATPFGSITITVGSGGLNYNADSGDDAVDVSPRETFVFTVDFQTVQITAFNNDNDANGDLLDLSAFGLSSFSQLDLAVAGNDWNITSDEFEGTITLVGANLWGEDWADFLVTNVLI